MYIEERCKTQGKSLKECEDMSFNLNFVQDV